MAARILVISKAAAFVRRCRWALKGMKVEVARTGHTALRRTETEPFGVIVLDLDLAECDPLDLFRRIRETDPRPKVIAMTQLPSVDTAVKVMKLGAFEYAVKPFTSDALRALVMKALEGASLEKNIMGQDQQKKKPAGSLSSELPRSIRATIRDGSKAVIVGLNGTFEPETGLLSLLLESLGRRCAPVSVEYGTHEVMGKEIITYLEDNDKVIVVASARIGKNPGEVITITSECAGDQGKASTAFELPRIGFPYIIRWARSIGMDCDLTVIAIEPNKDKGLCPFTETLQEQIVARIIAEAELATVCGDPKEDVIPAER